jgi:hypothetical protein
MQLRARRKAAGARNWLNPADYSTAIVGRVGVSAIKIGFAVVSDFRAGAKMAFMVGEALVLSRNRA